MKCNLLKKIKIYLNVNKVSINQSHNKFKI